MASKTNRGFALNLIPKDKDNANINLRERLSLVDKPVPPLAKGEVLIEVLKAPINPSDLVYLMGKYGLPPVDGAYAGFEACGTVIDANAGWYGNYLKGKRVAFFALPGKDGVWAKYAITKPSFCIPLRSDISDAQAATLVVNPLTSICLVERAIELNAKAIVINAAASQVGKGVIRYTKLTGIKTIATVRSSANVEALQQLGADHVLVTTDENFNDHLKRLTQELKATVLLDAVADEDTPNCLAAMPNRSTAIVYGRLTDTHDPIGGQFRVADVIFRDIKIEGFCSHLLQKGRPTSHLALNP